MEKIFYFFNDHFETIFAFHACWLFGIVFYLVAVRVLYFFDRVVHRGLNAFLSAVLMAGEIVLVVLTVSVVLGNLRVGFRMDLAGNLQDTTAWALEDLRVYYIDGKRLIETLPNRSGDKVLLEAKDPVREYHFSPDGKYILAVTEADLILIDRDNRQAQNIASLDMDPIERPELKGVISGVRWSPDSQRFCYRLSHWTPFSSHDKWYVRDLKKGDASELKTLGLKILDLSWDAAGDYLYFSWFDTLNPSVYASGYHVKLFRVFLDKRKPEMISQFPFNQPTLPPENWELHGVSLYMPDVPMSFGRGIRVNPGAFSSRRSRFGIDQDDELYYIKNRWWRKYLYKIPRLPANAPSRDSRFSKGDLEVMNLRWSPSGRYVMMEHYRFGILVLEPATARIGVLATPPARDFGWYPGATAQTSGVAP